MLFNKIFLNHIHFSPCAFNKNIVISCYYSLSSKSQKKKKKKLTASNNCNPIFTVEQTISNSVKCNKFINLVLKI